MIKLLGWHDYACQTGFGNVARNIMQNLQATGDFEIDVVGINYDGDPYDTEQWVGKIYPAMRGRMAQGVYADVFGRQRVLDLLATNDYDVLFMIQDTFVTKDYIEQLLETCNATNTKIVYYYPLDSTPQDNWITDVVSKVDFPITYTQYAKTESLKVDPALTSRLEVIYHGTNLDDFHPVKGDREAFRNAYFKGAADGKFVIMNLNRNQPRKDVLRSLLIQAELKQRDAGTLLYLHMAGVDVGGDIDEWAKQLGLEKGVDYIYPENFGDGVPLALVNQLYSAVDCLLTTTHGEGWGLSLTEAMATKLPIVAPDVTSISEILANNRGILVPSGQTLNDWYTQGHGDNNRLRPLMDVQAAADAIQKIQEGALPDFAGAYDWAVAQDWGTISKQFEAIIRRAAKSKSKHSKTLDGKVVSMNRAQRRKMGKT
jgi:glycosyltransferase involved in cell wall biosynthesis